jgi:hypothetical protein
MLSTLSVTTACASVCSASGSRQPGCTVSTNVSQSPAVAGCQGPLPACCCVEHATRRFVNIRAAAVGAAGCTAPSSGEVCASADRTIFVVNTYAPRLAPGGNATDVAAAADVCAAAGDTPRPLGTVTAAAAAGSAVQRVQLVQRRGRTMLQRYPTKP